MSELVIVIVMKIHVICHHGTQRTRLNPQGTDPLTNSFLGYGYDVDTKDACTAISQKRPGHQCICYFARTYPYREKKENTLFNFGNEPSLHIRTELSFLLPSGVLATARKTPPRRVKARLSHALVITSDTIGQSDTFSSKIIYTDRIQASQYQVHMTLKSRSQAPVHERPIN